MSQVSFNGFTAQVEKIAKELEREYGFKDLLIMVTHGESEKLCTWFTSFKQPQEKLVSRHSKILSSKLSELNLGSYPVQKMFSNKNSFDYGWTICLYNGIKNKKLAFA